jgi:hypothetical protein
MNRKTLETPRTRVRPVAKYTWCGEHGVIVYPTGTSHIFGSDADFCRICGRPVITRRFVHEVEPR